MNNMKNVYDSSKLNNREIKTDVKTSGPKWTEEQTEAIKARDCNLLVAAAAGAGKTAVLVERIIRKITDKTNPVDIDRMLIVTFTNAAAAEMRERIRDAITKELDKSPDSESIRRQLSLLTRASIMTIHSFCKDVISKHIENIDIDPNFRVADETESTLMRIEAMNDIIIDQYEQDRQDFLNLLDWYGGNRNDQNIQDIVMSLYNFVQSSAWPEQWLKDKVEAMDINGECDFAKTLWGRVILKSCQMEVDSARNMLLRAIDILYSAEGLEKYLPVFEEDLSNINNLLKKLDASQNEQGEDIKNSWDEIYDLIQKFKFARLPRVGKNADKEKQVIVKRVRDCVKDIVNKKVAEKLITDSSHNIIKDIKTIYPVMRCLARLVTEFSIRYNEKKRSKSVIDFNDLEHLCLKILTERKEKRIVPSSVALEYRDYFDEIMVDEYQDSNMVQEIIIRMISTYDTDKPNVFMVGDVKQSIYRFRQAKPELFLEKYNTYGIAKNGKNRKILLYKNFRSRSEIINAVNFIFGTIMSADAGEIDYTEKEALNSGASYEPCKIKNAKVGGDVEFHLIQTDDENDASDDSSVENSGGDVDSLEHGDEGEITEIIGNIQSEARLVAEKILELTSQDRDDKYFYVFDKSKKAYRKAEFNDIVILLRATKNWSDVFIDELAAKGIPAFADTGTGFFKTIEVQVVLSLLQIIDNPLQDIPLLSVLRSPIFSFTTGELAALRTVHKKALIYDALKMLTERKPINSGTEVDKSAANKALMFIEKLSLWREKARHMSTDQLIWYLYQETGYYNMVGAMPQGHQRQANLRVLYDRARQFEETSYKGLFNFINFIDKIKSNRGDMGSAKILGENDNVVRIMSIHKSKGLEFPIVFLSGCGKRFNLMDMNNNVLMHHELGLGPDVVDLKLRLSWPSAAKIAISERIRIETLSEEMRILYVAMTRAREKLIITATVRNIEKIVSKWKEISSGVGEQLNGSEVLRCSSYADWIGATLLKQKPEIQMDNKKEFFIDTPVPSELDKEKVGDSYKWLVKAWNKNDMVNLKLTGDVNEYDLNCWLDSIEKTKHGEYWDEVTKRLNWEYPYDKLGKIPAKVTVTELKRRFEAEVVDEAGRIPVQVPTLIKKPLFLEERKGLSAAEKGTILHFVMQHLDFKNSDIKGQIESMIKNDLLTEQQAQTVKTEKINIFLNSELGKRLLTSKNVQREIPFNIEIPAHELYLEMVDNKYQKETILLQGIIDCYFEEDDGLVLIDYKTDYVPYGENNVIIERYRIQLEYYARTLTILTGKKVKEKYIYLFSTGEMVEM